MIQGVDRAMAIAAQAFTALIPLLLLVSALAPTDSQDIVSDAIIRRFALGHWMLKKKIKWWAMEHPLLRPRHEHVDPHYAA